MNSRATELLPSESVQSDAEETQDKGRRVARIQGGLASLGYNPGPADGILDPGTRAAIRAFQVDHGLSATGEVSDELDGALLEFRVARAREKLAEQERASIKKHSTGSGFAVSGEGHILTNYHVVKDCREVRLPIGVPVRVIADDAQSDLALLEGQDVRLDEGRLTVAPLQRRGFSCVAGPNRFKVTSPRGQRYGDFLMQRQTLLFEIVFGAIAVGAVLLLMWLLGLTT